MNKEKSYDTKYIDIMLDEFQSKGKEPYSEKELKDMPQSLRLKNEIHAKYLRKIETLKAQLSPQEFKKEKERLFNEMANKFFEIDESVE